MSRLRVKIDDFIPDFQPLGLDTLEVNIRFDVDERTFLQLTNDIELTFTGDAYDYFQASMKENGYNKLHTIRVYRDGGDGNFAFLWIGKVFTADMQNNIKKKQIAVALFDSGYSTYIKNNKNIPIQFTIDKSKNGVDIASELQPTIDSGIRIHKPPSNTIPATILSPPAYSTDNTRSFYPVQEVFKFMTAFMSDSQISFVTNFFDDIDTNQGIRYGLNTGRNLRMNGTDILMENAISFNELYLDITALFNLVLTVDSSEEETVLRIENIDYIRNTDVSATVENPEEVNQSFFQEVLYNYIGIGSSDGIKDNSIGSLTYLPPFDFGDDSYYISGVTNIDKQLQLSLNTLIVDSNIIEDVMINNNDEYDNRWFLVAYDKTNTQTVTPASNIFSNGNYYYNGDFVNRNVINRYNLQGGAVTTAGDPDEDLIALKGTIDTTDFNGSAPTGVQVTGNFGDVIADPSGVWNTTTNKYTAIAGGIRNVSFVIHTKLNQEVFSFNGSIADPTYYSVPGQTLGYLITPQIFINGTEATDENGDPLGEQFKRMHYPMQQTFLPYSKTPLDTPILLEAGDELTVSHLVQVIVWTWDYDIYNLLLNNAEGLLWSWVTKQTVTVGSNTNADFIYAVLTQRLAIVTGLKIDHVASTSIIVQTQGSLNGIPVSDSKSIYAYTNRFEFNQHLPQKEMANILESPQNAIILLDKSDNIETKLWPASVGINLSTGATRFELINNIANL